MKVIAVTALLEDMVAPQSEEFRMPGRGVDDFMSGRAS